MSSRKYKQYPAEFMESSAKLALETDQPMSQTARELGVTPKSLYSWVNAYSGDNGKTSASKEPASEEIKRLKKELSRITLERDRQTRAREADIDRTNGKYGQKQTPPLEICLNSP